MQAVRFGTIGVCVEGYTNESLYAFLESQYLGGLLDKQYFKNSKEFNQNMYLQSEIIGPYREDTTLNVHEGYIHYTTDMDTFLLILRTAVLDLNLANVLVSDLYIKGLIKPRNVL